MPEEEQSQKDDLEQDKQENEQADELLDYAYEPLPLVDIIAPQAQKALTNKKRVFHKSSRIAIGRKNIFANESKI